MVVARRRARQGRFAAVGERDDDLATRADSRYSHHLDVDLTRSDDPLDDAELEIDVDVGAPVSHDLLHRHMSDREPQ